MKTLEQTRHFIKKWLKTLRIEGMPKHCDWKVKTVLELLVECFVKKLIEEKHNKSKIKRDFIGIHPDFNLLRTDMRYGWIGHIFIDNVINHKVHDISISSCLDAKASWIGHLSHDTYVDSAEAATELLRDTVEYLYG